METLEEAKITPDFVKLYLKKGLIYTIILVLFIITIYSIGRDIDSIGFPIKEIIGLGSLILIFLIILYYYIYSNVVIMWIEDDKLILQKGVIERQRKRIPLYKITDTLIKQDYVDRLLKSAGVYINTSGHPTYEIAISSVDFDEAEKFHEELYKKLKEYGNADINKERDD